MREAEKAGAVVEVLDLKALALPVYDQDIEDAGFPEPVTRLKAALAQAQGLIISSPEYNHSTPGGLKNAIDWASRPPTQPFRDKAVLLMGATPGPGGTVYAQSHLRESLVGLGAWVLPYTIMLSHSEAAFDEQGQLRDEGKRKQMARLPPLLVQMIRQGVPGAAKT